MADELQAALRDGLDVSAASRRVWERLWPQEKRTQASFHVFGMELLATLDLNATNDFFNTFFRLPPFYWRGFLASTLSSGQLIAFALVVFTLAPWNIKYKLIEHLITGGWRKGCGCGCGCRGLAGAGAGAGAGADAGPGAGAGAGAGAGGRRGWRLCVWGGTVVYLNPTKPRPGQPLGGQRVAGRGQEAVGCCPK